MNKTLALTGGGTMGHISPNLALLSEFKKHFSKIIYIGSKDSMEEKKAKEFGLPFFAVPVIKFDRKNLLRNLKIPCTLKRARKQVVEILKNNKVDVVFSKGGFVSVPVMLGATQAGVPYVLHESDMTLGLANKLGSRHAKQIFVATEKAKTSLPKKYQSKTVVTGIPVKDDFQKSSPTPFMQNIKNKTNKKIMVVTGGSQGSKKLNEVIRSCLPFLTAKFHVIHITGKGNLDPTIQNKNYEQIEFTDHMPDYMKLSNVVVSRGGATTIFEGLKSEANMIVVPLEKSKHSRGDQVENAKYFSSLELIEWTQENLDKDKLMSLIDSIEKNKTTRLKNIKNFNSSIMKNAKIAEFVSKIAKK